MPPVLPVHTFAAQGTECAESQDCHALVAPVPALVPVTSLILASPGGTACAELPPKLAPRQPRLQRMSFLWGQTQLYISQAGHMLQLTVCGTRMLCEGMYLSGGWDSYGQGSTLTFRGV